MASMPSHPCTSPADADLERIKANEERHRRRELVGAACIPDRHMQVIRDGLSVEAWSEAARPAVERAIDVVRANGLLCLLGPRGTGKTQLVAWLVYGCCMSLGLPAKYRRWGDLLGELRHKAYTESASEVGLVDGLSRLGLLAIDELHEARGTADEALWLGRIIDHRYGARKPTVLVANLTPEAMAQAVGPSAWDRMCEGGAVVELKGESFRRRGGAA